MPLLAWTSAEPASLFDDGGTRHNSSEGIREREVTPLHSSVAIDPPQ